MWPLINWVSGKCALGDAWSLTVLRQGCWALITPVLFRYSVLNGQVLVGKVFPSLHLLWPLIHPWARYALKEFKENFKPSAAKWTTHVAESRLSNGYDSIQAGRKVLTSVPSTTSKRSLTKAYPHGSSIKAHRRPSLFTFTFPASSSSGSPASSASSSELQSLVST